MKKLLFVLSAVAAFNINLFSQDKPEVTVKDLQEINMVYYEFTGPYEQSFNEFGQLMGFIQQNKIPMGTYSLGIYYDDPATVSAEKLRSEIGFAVTKKVETTGKYKFKTIPAGKALSIKYTSMADITSAYEKLGKYISENGIKTVPYSVEIYFGNDPNVIDAEILFPIAE